MDTEKVYCEWRDRKLAGIAACGREQPVVVEIRNPCQLTQAEREQLQLSCRHNNFAIYRLTDPRVGSKDTIRSFTQQLGMHRLDNNLCADKDSLSSIEVRSDGHGAGYIPYTCQALGWHTDGYYNVLGQHIRSFLLHCVQPAANGGENYLLDHEQIYIQLREQDPALAQALMHPQAMTIPANEQSGAERQAQTGPVFYVDSQTGCLQMRYTSRTRSIVWREDSATQAAVQALRQMISIDNPCTVCYRLQAGEGIICNNILHSRSAFTDANIPQSQRLLYRARSYQRLFDALPESAQPEGKIHAMAE